MADVRPSQKSAAPKARNTFDDILAADMPDVPVVQVVGDFTDRVRFVSASSMSLLLGFAKIDETDRTVLIPYLETKVEGGSPSDVDGEVASDVMFSQVLTLENAAFMTVNLVSDMRSACEDLAGVAGSATRPERARLEQTRYLLAHAVKEALAATSQLTAILDSYPQAE